MVAKLFLLLLRQLPLRHLDSYSLWSKNGGTKFWYLWFSHRIASILLLFESNQYKLPHPGLQINVSINYRMHYYYFFIIIITFISTVNIWLHKNYWRLSQTSQRGGLKSSSDLDGLREGTGLWYGRREDPFAKMVRESRHWFCSRKRTGCVVANRKNM